MSIFTCSQSISNQATLTTALSDHNLHFLKINFRSRHLSFPFLFVLFLFLFWKGYRVRKPQKKKRSNTKKRTKEVCLDVAEMLQPVTFFFHSCLSRPSQIRLCGSSFFHRQILIFFFLSIKAHKKKGACSIASERERDLLSLVIFDRSIPASIGIIVINDKKNQLNKKIANANKKCVLSKTESFQLTWMKLLRERPQWQSQK